MPKHLRRIIVSALAAVTILMSILNVVAQMPEEDVTPPAVIVKT